MIAETHSAPRAEAPLPAPWDTVLAPLGSAYGALTRLRAAFYRKGWRESASLPEPVISVGNLTAGGSGKTPVVAWIAQAARAAGRQPADAVEFGHAARAFSVFQRRHLAWENGTVLPLARKRLTAADQADMGRRMADRRRSLVAG